MREGLKSVFLTGVSKFSKVSLFSGLNHLRDITLDPRHSALCGYTDGDVNTVFAAELPSTWTGSNPRRCCSRLAT
jgi:Predicted AAA-ATPase